jgi:hypothetical protein
LVRFSHPIEAPAFAKLKHIALAVGPARYVFTWNASLVPLFCFRRFRIYVE